MPRIFQWRERPDAGQPRACMDWSGRTHATYFACAFEALAPIVVTIGVKVKILHSESWVVVIDHNVRISITITKGLCMYTDVCQLCRDILHSSRRLLKCKLGRLSPPIVDTASTYRWSAAYSNFF